MSVPKIKVEQDSFDKIVEIIGVIAILALIGLPIIYYNTLPETIPRHYNLNGEPDGFSGKGIIWTLPIIGLILYVGMAIANEYPHIFNYPKKITKENAGRQYRAAAKMIRVLNTLIACTSAYITHATIQTALGNQNGLGNYFTPIFMILVFGTVRYYLYKTTL